VNEISVYEPGYMKGYSEDFKKVSRIAKWRDVKISNRYYRNGVLFARDFIFPSYMKKQVSQILEL